MNEWPQDRLEKFWRGLGITENRDEHGDLLTCFLVGSNLVPWQDDLDWFVPTWPKRHRAGKLLEVKSG